MKLCFVTILEPVNLPEIFDDALIWESTQKKTDNLIYITNWGWFHKNSKWEISLS